MIRAVRVLCGLAVAVVASVLGFAAPAVASSTEEDLWEVVFTGMVVSFSTGPDGEVSNGEDYEQTLFLRCTPEECLYFLDFSQSDLALSAARASASTTWSASGEVCDNDWRGPGRATLSFADTSLTLAVQTEGSGWKECGEGSRSATFASDRLLVAEWVSGDLCVLEGTECPPVAAAEPETEATLIATPVDGQASSSSSSSFLSTGDIAAPSVLSTLATPAQAGTAPEQLLIAALLTVILALLVAFPTALLNSAVDAGSERLAAWRESRRAEPARVSRRPKTWWWAAAGVVAASVISAFVDPQFGFNPGSGRVLLSILTGFALDVVLGWTVTVWIVKRAVSGATHSYVFRPITLLVVVLAVVFTRITGFEPGIVFGLVAGVAFGAIVGRSGQARAVLAALGYAFGIAVVAWLLYGALGGGAAAGESFWGTFLIETLSTLAIGGMAALPIALVPVRGLAGHAIWSWNRWLWGACYAVGLLAFFIVLLPMPFSWAEVSLTLGSWVGLYVVYAVVATGLWLILTRPWDREPPHADIQATEPAVASQPADRVEG